MPQPPAGLLADPYDLRRFVEAQNPIYAQVCAELRAGVKQGHWMWFIFPQIQGLGGRPMAHKYAITCMEEAAAYLQHPITGPRLEECCRIVNGIEGRTVNEIFGYPDNLKFHSSMTLFSRAQAETSVFRAALQRYFGGQEDRHTLQHL